MKKKWKMILDESKDQIWKAYQQIEDKGGFPEVFGKQRITEWGGTISGLHIIKDLDNYGVTEKVEASLKSILDSQDPISGAWGAGEIDLVEATSDIVYFLNEDFKDRCVLTTPINKAIDFIKSRYSTDGYFKTNAYSNGFEHSLYSTYSAVRSLMNVNKLDNTWKLQIKQWIKDSKNARIGLWGEIPHSSVCTISHSIYALRTLECIDGNVREKYPDEINRLYKLILKNSYPFEYEEYSFPKKKKDSDGKNYDRVRINHFILPLAIDFFITIGDMAKARFLVKVLINNHHNGRWGLYDTLHTVWATQQAVDAITYFDSKEKDFIYYIECAKLWCYRNLTSIIVGILIVSLLVIILLRDGVGTTIISVLVGTCTGVAANMLTDWYRTGIGNHRAF